LALYLKPSLGQTILQYKKYGRTEFLQFKNLKFCCYEYLTKENLEGFGGFKTEGQAIRTVKYAYDLAPLTQEEPVLQGMIDRLIVIGR